MAAPDPSFEAQFPGFCNDRQATEMGALTCDLPKGHGGERHKETYVATWNRDGTGVLYFDDKSGRYSVSPPEGQT